MTDRKRIAAALLSTCVLMLVAAVPGWAARTVRVGSHPVATAFGGGAAWVANKGDGTVTRINLTTGRVLGAPIRVGGRPTSITFAEGFIWVTSFDDGTLVKIDPVTGLLAGSPIRIGSSPDHVVIGNGSAWITHFEGPISRFSTSTGTKLGDSRGKGNYQGETLVGSSLWVVENTHRLLIQVRIKPDTFLGGKVVRVGTAPYAVVSGFGSLWVNNFVDTTVSRIAPATGKVKRSIDRVGSALGPDSMTAALGRIWVTDQDKNRLLGINPKRNTVDRKLHAGPMPVSVASEGSRLWVTNYKAGTVSIVTP